MARLSETSHRGMRERVRRYARRSGLSRAAKRAARRIGIDLIGRDYYSPVPDLEQLPGDVWTRASELRGVRFDAEAALELAGRKLAPFLAEYQPPRKPTGNPRDFHLDNGFYGSVDAEMLYAMIRYLSPKRIVELGSGASTLVIADARTQNGPEGLEHRIFDPFPRAGLTDVLASVGELHRVPATDIPLDEFRSLAEGDVLFVDTTHTVKLASDVNWIVLDVLPLLAPGVFVHFHDIFLPWDYPRVLVDRGFFWAEQYLLQAFLAFNDVFEVVLPVHALHMRYPDEMAALVPSAPASFPPSAFWLKRL